MGRSGWVGGCTRRLCGLLLTISLAPALGAALDGCKEKALDRSARSDAGDTPGGLTPAQASLVLAKVDDREITLGEFAATLDQMDQFDRMRYQTPERRRELLDQMITVELLAAEARRRGLDKDPETVEAMRQVLRDALLADLRHKGRAPIEIPEPEVRAYFEGHKAEFEEPERRRLAHIVVKDKAKAEKLLGDAKKASPVQWGEFVLDHSLESPGRPYRGAVELLGDLGIVGPPEDPRGANPKVDAQLQKAAFEMAKPGDVLDRVVQTADGTWHIVRLIGKTDAHTRTYAEAERTIRIALSQKGLAEAEKATEADLRKRFPVQVDDAALANVHLTNVDAGVADVAASAMPRAPVPARGP